MFLLCERNPRVRHRRDIHTNNIQFPGRHGIYEKDEPRIGEKELRDQAIGINSGIYSTRQFQFTTNTVKEILNVDIRIRFVSRVCSLKSALLLASIRPRLLKVRLKFKRESGAEKFSRINEILHI